MAGQQYKAKYDHVATAEGTLSFKTGDQFTLVRKTNNDWWMVRSMSGDTGLAPVSYLEAIGYMQTIGSSVKKSYYTTLYDYTAQNSTQLTFVKGETLTLVDKTDVSWWTMKSTSGNQGLVPVNYIDKLDTPDEKVTSNNSPTHQTNGTSSERESVLLSIDTQIQKIHDTAGANGGIYTREMRATLQTLLAHRKAYVDSQKNEEPPPTSPVKTLAQPPRSPSSSPKSVKRTMSSPRVKRQAPPPPTNAAKSRTQSETKEHVVKREKSAQSNADFKDNRYSLQADSTAHDSEQFRHRFGSLPRKSAPAPPNRRDSISKDSSPPSSKPPQHPSSPRKTKIHQDFDQQNSSTFNPAGRRYSESIQTTGTLPPGSSPPRQRSLSSSYRGSQTLDSRKRTDSGSSGGSPRYSRSRSSSKEIVLQPKLELPKNFTKSDGAELVENIRKRTAISYRKTLLAVSGVLEFLKEKVPLCTDMVDGLMTAVQESQVEKSPSATRKAEASSDLERLRELLFEISEAKNDSQQRGWAVHDDEQAIVDILEELLQILCDANPDISKAAIEEDKYENILTIITYYQMEPRLSIRLLLLKVFGVLCGLDQTVVAVLLSSVLPGELGRDIQQDIRQIQKTLYSCTVCTMIFSTGEAVPLPIYDQWSEDYILFLLETIEQPLPEDKDERVSDAFLNMILSFNQHFPDPSTNLVMKAIRRSSNPRNFSEKLMFLVNRGEDPVAISTPCCPDSMTKFLLDLFADKETSGLFYTTDLMVVIDIVARQLADLGPDDELRVHCLELLFRIVATTNYSEHKHRQHVIVTSLNRIAQEENAVGTPDYELVKKIWKTYPGIFEEVTDL